MKAIGGGTAKRTIQTQANEIKMLNFGNAKLNKPIVPPPPPPPPQKYYMKSYTYSAQPINRFQIFFSSAMNRFPGIFAKSKKYVIQIYISIRDKESLFIFIKLID